ncbi:response regulator receiver domain protein [marine gamma proteobacterium HTCC2148]|jgi:two-component system OmpR family response regulator|nr:response regulator receiver domain protein [marine gamma proteobacterium HTCC2148]MBT3411215.1 proteobacterial dedicated sortase system response regulator [Halieaceae bacterium]MBT5007402.1 proteobacterial dedicated sortase system response regulator [Halieaceae bacterium]MBT6125699.1 proteobacterial dedicated sortase system response regulator [Halieaceae bacterium]MBT7719660.1 proteobacterial dedicated sortase system response regulator [Halieaceae bacterium]
MQQHIAIVEDEAAIAANYRDHLQRQGFRVSLFADRDSAADAFAIQLPDLAIIDVGLGKEMEGGFELCRDLRARAPGIPIVFLTARDSELDIISGFRLGADDYLTKGISQAQLTARINALFRRVKALQKPEQEKHLVVQGALELNKERMTANWRGLPLELSVTEFWMVHTLALHPGHVKNRQQLMDCANVVLDDNTITSHIKRIRRKFQALDADFGSIDTAYGVGYRWKG